MRLARLWSWAMPSLALALACLGLLVTERPALSFAPPGLEVSIQPGPPRELEPGKPFAIAIVVRNTARTEGTVDAPSISNPDITAVIELPPNVLRVAADGRQNYAGPQITAGEQRTTIEWRAVPEREKIGEGKAVTMTVRLTLIGMPESQEFNLDVTARSVDGYADQRVFPLLVKQPATATPSRTATARTQAQATLTPPGTRPALVIATSTPLLPTYTPSATLQAAQPVQASATPVLITQSTRPAGTVVVHSPTLIATASATPEISSSVEVFNPALVSGLLGLTILGLLAYYLLRRR